MPQGQTAQAGTGRSRCPPTERGRRLLMGTLVLLLRLRVCEKREHEMKRRKVRHGFLYRLGIRRIRPIGQGHDDAAEQ